VAREVVEEILKNRRILSSPASGAGQLHLLRRPGGFTQMSEEARRRRVAAAHRLLPMMIETTFKYDGTSKSYWATR